MFRLLAVCEDSPATTPAADGTAQGVRLPFGQQYIVIIFINPIKN
nr:MAG TPA: hypothetical protein [Caudoviricetes sp.]DAO57391.1 MAG TPA: hypothetical protein [Caudoviricetes sp.]